MDAGFRSHCGPFVPPRRPVVDRPGRSIILGIRCELDDRLLNIARTREGLFSRCQSFFNLPQDIFDAAFKYFFYAGKSAVFVGVWKSNEFSGQFIPENLPPLPGNTALVSGEVSKFPIQHELVEEAISTKNIIQGKSENEEFLAVPLVSEDRNTAWGILLLSNRYSRGKNAFAPDDVVMAKTLAEVFSEAISNLFPLSI